MIKIDFIELGLQYDFKSITKRNWAGDQRHFDTHFVLLVKGTKYLYVDMNFQAMKETDVNN